MKEEKVKKSKEKKSKAKKNYFRNKLAMKCIVIVVCMLLVVLLFEGRSLQKQVEKNDSRIIELQEQYEAEEKRTEEIEELQDYMQSAEYIEKYAKDKIGLIKENEIVFKENK